MYESEKIAFGCTEQQGQPKLKARKPKSKLKRGLKLLGSMRAYVSTPRTLKDNTLEAVFLQVQILDDLRAEQAGQIRPARELETRVQLLSDRRAPNNMAALEDKDIHACAVHKEKGGDRMG